LVLQSRSYGYAPSSQDKNHSEICDPCINKYWETGSYDTSLYVDSDHEYGDDCLIMSDEYGNVMIVLKRVAAGGASGKSRAKSKRVFEFKPR
ncbi:MAG: hypothetical protein K2I26_01490, partial [Paramuribaculum sp.]|nr:hypothetical protein [Paramuribaculum sp.]